MNHITKKLKIGDTLIRMPSSIETHRSVRYVQEIKVRFFTDNKGHRWRHDGNPYPRPDDNWHRHTWLETGTPAEVAEVKEENKRARLVQDKRTTDQLQRARDILWGVEVKL
jgi:hypothetical protein